MFHFYKFNKTTCSSLKLLSCLTVLAFLILTGSGVQAEDQHSRAEAKDCHDTGSQGQDIWIQGKLEGAYLFNKHLNPIEIDTEVKNGTVFLSGNVDSDIEKDLAGEIAKSVEGVKDVENKLVVRPENFKKNKEKSASKISERGFAQKVKDASITAAVKVKLLANSNTDGSDINVDTSWQSVVLKGHVKSSEEKDLAEKIASNTEDVLKVTNKLKVDKSKD